MAIIKSFKGIRPVDEYVKLVPSKPYDVLNTEEAREEAKDNPYSFLHVVKSEIDLPKGTDPYDKSVYEKARDNFKNLLEKGIVKQDPENYLYVYRQTMNGKSQTGLMACSNIEDYFNDVIKKHEFTRPVKEKDRINHMKTTNIHAGPVFLTYPDVSDIDSIINKITAQEPECRFTVELDVEHVLWVVKDRETINKLEGLFKEKVPATYIADGHHRAASSALVGKERKEANPNHRGDEEYNFFLSVLFPASQLTIIDYNRVVTDLNGHSKDELIEAIKEKFDVELVGEKQYKPSKPHSYGMYLDKNWYSLTAKEGIFDPNDPVDVLDISILQNNVLDALLGIKDPRTDDRVDFVGGIRGLGELEKRVNSGEMAIAFSLYPVSIEQLINIADSGEVMPPKSTWFEPKLKSGLVVHSLD